jgi:hypothetical protein
MIGINRRKFCEHRLAWLFMTGAWPKDYVDHINGDPSDNRWCNLRAADHFQNLQNSKLSKRNSSGHKGVHFHPQSGKWRVRIMVGRRHIQVGMFDSLEDAAAASKAAAEEYHGEFARTH